MKVRASTLRQRETRMNGTTMKKHTIRMVFALVWACFNSAAHADPQLDSWFTSYSGKYARIYATDADKTSGNAVNTWSRGTISQTVPAYCGIYFVANSAGWVYIRSTGLASHTMGPWYLNAARSQLFPNVPHNTASLYRIPRSPTA